MIIQYTIVASLFDYLLLSNTVLKSTYLFNAIRSMTLVFKFYKQ